LFYGKFVPDLRTTIYRKTFRPKFHKIDSWSPASGELGEEVAGDRHAGSGLHGEFREREEAANGFRGLSGGSAGAAVGDVCPPDGAAVTSEVLVNWDRFYESVSAVIYRRNLLRVSCKYGFYTPKVLFALGNLSIPNCQTNVGRQLFVQK
jgi:hypothetical protein